MRSRRATADRVDSDPAHPAGDQGFRSKNATLSAVAWKGGFVREDG
jgi:hypothetical protein